MKGEGGGKRKRERGGGGPHLGNEGGQGLRGAAGEDRESGDDEGKPEINHRRDAPLMYVVLYMLDMEYLFWQFVPTVNNTRYISVLAICSKWA